MEDYKVVKDDFNEISQLEEPKWNHKHENISLQQKLNVNSFGDIH